MTNPLITTVTTYVALRRLGLAAPEEVVTWAEGCVVGDPDSPDLAGIASLPRTATAAEVDTPLRDLARQLGIPPMTDQNAASVVATGIIQRLLAGQEEPIRAARHLTELAHRVPAAEPDLREFVGLSGEWDDDPAHRMLYDQDIRDLAAFWLEGRAAIDVDE